MKIKKAIVGVAAIGLLTSLGISPMVSHASTYQTTKSAISQSYPGHYLKEGSRGAVVRRVQAQLNRLGFHSGPEDGIFGSKTKRAVKAFQKSKKLQVDGIVGPRTWGSLFTQGGSSSSHPYPGHLVKYGDRGTAVKEVQHQLNAVGDNVGTADGIFGPKTLKGVKAFQKAQGLSVDGIVGPKTWSALFKKGPSEAPSGGFHHPNHWNQNAVLREGDSGKEVKNLQYILTVLTFYTKSEGVTADGIFGPKTKHAVEVYQRGHGLQPDGIVGPKTWNSLSKFIHKNNATTYSAGGYMGLRLEWKYDSSSDNSGCTVTVYGDGDHKTDSYRLSPDR